jgi:DNA mismatch endonuclease (patch repair protein)
MVDIVEKATRSRMMSRIRGKNTKPEMIIRSGLHGLGYRFRLHYKKLPGRPDIVLPRYKAIILINGCFWHGHDCHLFKWPKTRKLFWREKIKDTIERDRRNVDEYYRLGWRVLTVWECVLKRKDEIELNFILKKCALWIESNSQYKSIPDNEGQVVG